MSARPAARKELAAHAKLELDYFIKTLCERSPRCARRVWQAGRLALLSSIRRRQSRQTAPSVSDSQSMRRSPVSERARRMRARPLCGSLRRRLASCARLSSPQLTSARLGSTLLDLRAGQLTDWPARRRLTQSELKPEEETSAAQEERLRPNEEEEEEIFLRGKD